MNAALLAIAQFMYKYHEGMNGMHLLRIETRSLHIICVVAVSFQLFRSVTGYV